MKTVGEIGPSTETLPGQGAFPGSARLVHVCYVYVLLVGHTILYQLQVYSGVSGVCVPAERLPVRSRTSCTSVITL